MFLGLPVLAKNESLECHADPAELRGAGERFLRRSKLLFDWRYVLIYTETLANLESRLQLV